MFKDRESPTATASIVMRSTRDVNDATLVGDGGGLSHVISQQICQQERPCNKANKNQCDLSCGHFISFSISFSILFHFRYRY